jgi:hypothetical protein
MGRRELMTEELKEITKLEKGKTYKLIDKKGYEGDHCHNSVILKTIGLVEGSIFKIDEVCEGDGWYNNKLVISTDEFQYFREVVMVDGQDEKELTQEKVKVEMSEDLPDLPPILQTSMKNFKFLNATELNILFEAYFESKIIQEYYEDSDKWVDIDMTDRLCFEMDKVYRVKPSVKKDKLNWETLFGTSNSK